MTKAACFPSRFFWLRTLQRENGWITIFSIQPYAGHVVGQRASRTATRQPDSNGGRAFFGFLGEVGNQRG
jgi:hypothetical protein